MDKEVYESIVSKYKNANVLLLDDLFKGSISKSDVNIMFEIVNLRNGMSTKEKNEEYEKMNRNIEKLNVVVENYPDLKANQNFSELSEELRNTENKISFARLRYSLEPLELKEKFKTLCP